MMETNHSKNFLVLFLGMCGFQVMNLVINGDAQREVIAHLEAIQTKQRAGFSALGAALTPNHAQSNLEWRTEKEAREYDATHVYCSNLGAWVEKKNFAANDTADLAGNAGLKWDDCKGDWVSTTKGRKR